MHSGVSYPPPSGGFCALRLTMFPRSPRRELTPIFKFYSMGGVNVSLGSHLSTLTWVLHVISCCTHVFSKIALIDMWRSLLCSLAQNHTNAREAFNYVTTSLTGCLLSPPHGLDRQSNGQTWDIMDQYQLTYCHQTPLVCDERCYSCRTLPEAAHLILSAIINYKFNLDSELRSIWNMLCVDMMVFASAPVPGSMPTPSGSPIMVRKHRQLWVSVADCLIRDACSLYWGLIVDFLCIPAR